MKILMVHDYSYTIPSGNSTLRQGEIYEAEFSGDYEYSVKVSDRDKPVLVHKKIARVLEEVNKPTVPGVSPDQPVVYNEKGGGQSKSPYRMDLVDPKSILEIASVLKEGAEKYGDDNWKLISTQDHLNHLLVHVYAHLAGDESDKHLAHAACRAIFALGVELEDK
ncbi:dATP/dGTP diphosphohydrolase domain-containing protein [Solibacillus sp. FSL W7-1436]|uniref:dATP/dGTP diphosphohydrolase domain-containing protein n=1 Tax=Solibacillus sp. FSL W7-1436 TaxID=2921705 RepID=UPI0030F65C20